MFNLTLSERNYLIELIRKDQREQNLANQFYINTNKLIQYIEEQSFIDGFVDGNDKETDKSTNLCPDCNVYCLKRFIDGRCE